MSILDEVNNIVKSAQVRLAAPNLRRRNASIPGSTGNANTNPGVQQGFGFGYGMHPYNPGAGAAQAAGAGSPVATASAQAGAPAKASRGFAFSVPKKAPVGSVGPVPNYDAYRKQMADMVRGYKANTALGADQKRQIAAQLKKIHAGMKEGMTPEQYRRALYQARRVGANGTFSFGRGSQGGTANMSNPNYRQAFVNGRRVGEMKVNTTSNAPETDANGNLTEKAKGQGWNQFRPGISYRGKDQATKNFAKRMNANARYNGVMSGQRFSPQWQRETEALLADYNYDRNQEKTIRSYNSPLDRFKAKRWY